MRLAATDKLRLRGRGVYSPADLTWMGSETAASVTSLSGQSGANGLFFGHAQRLEYGALPTRAIRCSL